MYDQKALRFDAKQNLVRWLGIILNLNSKTQTSTDFTVYVDDVLYIIILELIILT